MISEEMKQQLEKIKKTILLFDIETSSHYPDGRVIDIKTDFNDYVKYAKVKWIGFYSYLHNEYINTKVKGHEATIIEYISRHDILLGFNNLEFDTVIMYNNNLMPEGKYYPEIDLKQILMESTFFGKDKKKFKGRGGLMGYKPKRFRLKDWAKVMELETQKGDIDYSIFHKDEWTPEEEEEIIKYLQADVMVTKQMFEKVWEFWFGFTEWLYPKDVENLSWIKSTIATLRYNCDCKTLGVEATYGKHSDEKEKMGGNVIEIEYEEARRAWYLDFKSLYPHLMAMFNLYAEMNSEELEMATVGPMGNGGMEDSIFHKSKDFETKGYYDISEQHPICKDIIEKIKLRIHLQKTKPGIPMIQCLKIWLNAGYGAARSEVFEQIHTPNIGWDTCWLGQQFQKLFEDMIEEFGFETIAGDTDSIFVVKKQGELSCKEFEDEKIYVTKCLDAVTKRLLENCPFPSDTFSIDIENYLDYVMWPFADTPLRFYPGDFLAMKESLKTFKYSEEHLNELYKFNQEKYNKKPTKKPNIKGLNSRLIKKNMGKKKNYVYIAHDKENKPYVKIMGLPIKKNNATELGPIILKEILIPKIIEEKTAKFDKVFINDILGEYLSKPEGMNLLARQYRVKQADSYKPDKKGNPSNHINAQISRAYFNGEDGIISIIKTKVPVDPEKKGYILVGKAGASVQYATVKECVEAGLSINEIDTEKVNNELQAFINSP